jgi:hypothetical protein
VSFRSTTKNAKSGRKNRSVTGKRVAGPDLCRVSAQKRAPLLTSRLVGANRPHVLLNSSLAHTDAEFQQFPTNPFSTPKPIVLGHLPDQGDRFRGDLGLANMSLGRALPIQAKELPMPPEKCVWLHDEEGLLPGSNQPGQQDEEDAIGPGERWPFTCRLRTMSGCRKRAFSAISSDLLFPRSVRVESGKEVLSGFVQRAKREESTSKQPFFSRRREVIRRLIEEASPSHESVVDRA